MNTKIPYYNNQIEIHQSILKQLYKKLTLSSFLRLCVFLITAIAIYYTFQLWQLCMIIGIIGIAVFLIILNYHTNKKAKYDLHKKALELLHQEIKIINGDYYDRPEGLEFNNPKHFYSTDVDLFGKGSFFQFLNRTTIKEGSEVLAEILKSNDIYDIQIKQKAIEELSKIPEWRIKYNATSSLIKVETETSQIIYWLKHYTSVFKKPIQWLPLSFSIISILLISLSFLKIIDAYFPFFWLLIGLGIVGLYLKKINVLALHTDKLKVTFKQYALLLEQIETENFLSKLLKEKQELIKSDHKKASHIFTEFSKQLDAFDNRNNFISAIFGNGFLLSDIKNAYKIEQWILKYNYKVNDWFEVISFFDAYNSLGNYAFNHPNYVFPNIIDSKTLIINANDLGHPLLKTDKLVSNNISINKEQFFIVTGANMAGKSTFLRTVSLHIVMANVGLPVCASSSDYNPIKLITSMRTNDSLSDDSSYFFAELTRLKFIVDEISKEPYFIILDEILKGTNSTDKAIGSRKFVEKLVSSNATGIIATHDLSLCEIEKELKEVKNYYFDAEILNNELHFDYKFKKGICKNMNASFLLKKMQII